jgi:hypothetical protein
LDVSQPNAPAEFRSQWLLSPKGFAQLLVRVLVTSLLAAAGLGMLAFLQRGDWTSTGKIQVDEDAVMVATAVAVQCQIVLAGLALLSELALCLFLWSHSWRWGQMLVPFAWGLLGGSLYFPPAAYHPKEILLLSGSTLVTFVGGMSYVILWQNAVSRHLRIPELSPRDLPVTWLVALILLASAFLGGARGWSGDRTAFRRLWEYRTERWGDEQDAPPLDAPPVDTPTIL